MLELVTDGDITITEVRVEQTKDESVDTTGYVGCKFNNVYNYYLTVLYILQH